MPPHPPVSVVVLNWHARAHTLACLRALARLDYPDWSLILVDNGCCEFSARDVSGFSSGSRYLRSETNLGFAGGANLGLREALRGVAAYVWFLNNDTEPEPPALRELVTVAEGAADIGVVGPKILLHDDPRRLDSIALHLDLRWGRIFLLGHNENDRGQYDHLSDALAVTGCAMLVRRAACEQLRGFDERFFAYLEDADLCLRARAAGWRVAVAPRARVLHERPSATDGRQSLTSLSLTARNHLLLLERHGRGPGWWRPVQAGMVVALNLLYALRSGGAGSARARLAAVWQGVRAYQRGLQGGQPFAA